MTTNTTTAGTHIPSRSVPQQTQARAQPDKTKQIQHQRYRKKRRRHYSSTSESSSTSSSEEEKRRKSKKHKRHSRISRHSRKYKKHRKHLSTSSSSSSSEEEVNVRQSIPEQRRQEVPRQSGEPSVSSGNIQLDQQPASSYSQAGASQQQRQQNSQQSAPGRSQTTTDAPPLVEEEEEGEWIDEELVYEGTDVEEDNTGARVTMGKELL